MSVKGVLFDLEGTLVKKSLDVPEVFHEALIRNKIFIPIKDIEKAFIKVQKEQGATIQEQCGKIPRLEYHNLWNTSILKNLGVKDPNKNIVNELGKWIDICGIAAQPGAFDLLSILKAQKFKTGIVSGIYEKEIHTILQRVNLNKPLFDTIVGADTIKKLKPDPDVFLYALQKLAISPQEAIFVGDNLEKDYKAAQRVGMTPFLLIPPEKSAFYTVRKITRLLLLLDHLNTKSFSI
ncbi:MAG: HAD family hydrolase [Candidatus Methanofastidiosia archaeon]|jgi:putative hydrolase of the HAD superfamily